MTTKKKKIDFSDESIQQLMQETYYEIVDERNRALAGYKKVTKNMDENTDIALVGKVGNDLLKIIDGSIEKKLRLIKMQIDVVYKNTGKAGDGGQTSDNPGVLSAEDRKMVEDMLKKDPLFAGATEEVKKYD